MEKFKRQIKAIQALAAAQRLDVRDHTPAGLPLKLKPEEMAEIDNARSVLSKTLDEFQKTGSVFDDGFRALDDPLLEERCLGWKRLHEFFGPGTSLSADRFDPLSLSQGRIGDCFLVASLATATAVPGFLERLFMLPAGFDRLRHSDTNDAGIYLVRLWNHPRQRFDYIWVCDLFPACKDRVFEFKTQKIFAHDIPRLGMPEGCGYVPLMMTLRKSGAYKGGNGFAFWPMLLEKACAMLFGSYAAIGRGGTADLVLGSLISNMTFGSLNLREARVGQRAASGSLWAELEAMERSGFFMVAGAAGKTERVNENGIVAGHAYSILRVVATSDNDGKEIKLIQLRNPWSSGEWKGRCSDFDTAFWTREMKQKLRYNINTAGTEAAKQENDDGVFWMLLEDWLMVFGSLCVCRFLKTVDYQDGLWHRYQISGQWLPGVLANPGLNAAEVDQFTITPTASGDVFVVCEAGPDPASLGDDGRGNPLSDAKRPKPAALVGPPSGGPPSGAPPPGAPPSGGAPPSFGAPPPGKPITGPRTACSDIGPGHKHGAAAAGDASAISFFGSPLKGSFCVAVTCNGGRRVEEWEAIDRVSLAGAGELKGAAALRFKTSAPSATMKAAIDHIKSAGYDLNSKGTDSACVHVSAVAGEPITIIPLHNTIEGQSHYRISVFADAPLVVNDGSASGAGSSSAAEEEEDEDDDCWSDDGWSDISSEEEKANLALRVTAAAAPMAAPAASAAAHGKPRLSLHPGKLAHLRKSAAGSDEAQITAESIARGALAFNLLPPATIRDLRYFQRHPFTTLCMKANNPSAPAAALATNAATGWDKVELVSVVPSACKEDEMIRMPMAEQVVFTVAKRKHGAATAGKGKGGVGVGPTAEEGVVYAFVELFDAKTHKPFSRPIKSGRLLLVATQTLPTAPGENPCRIQEYGESPKLMDDRAKGKAPPAPAPGKGGAGATPATAGGAVGTAGSDDSALFWSDFVTPLEGKAAGAATAAIAAGNEDLIPLPVGCVRVAPRFDADGTATLAVSVANCTTPDVGRYRLTIITNLKFVPPADAAMVKGGSPITLSPPEMLESDDYYRLQEADSWFDSTIYGTWPSTALNQGGILLNKQEQYLITTPTDCIVGVFLRAGVKKGGPEPPKGDGGQGSIVLAVTPNDTGKPARSWEACPLSKAGQASLKQEPFFKNDITEFGDLASINFYARAGCSYSIMAIPNDWSGSPSFRLGVFSTAALAAIGDDGSCVKVVKP